MSRRNICAAFGQEELHGPWPDGGARSRLELILAASVVVGARLWKRQRVVAMVCGKKPAALGMRAYACLYDCAHVCARSCACYVK